MAVDAAIAEYDVIENPPEALRAVVEMAAIVAGAPMAAINILTSESQHQVAAVGFDASVCRREDSMCRLAVEQRSPILVPDAQHDDRFRENPFVTGEIGDVRFYASHPLTVRDGVVIGTLCVFDEVARELDETQRRSLLVLAERIVDILELARRTRELDAAVHDMTELQDELRRSNEHLSAFAGEVSHDLAGPLSTVTLSLGQIEDRLEARPDEAEDLGRWVETGLRGADRMYAMIREFLAFARVGGLVDPRPTDLSAVTADACLDLGVEPGDQRVVVGELPVVLGDAGQLRAVMQNLLTNAFKFSDGTTPVEIGAVEVEGGWRVEVADRGVGIAAEDARRVFEPLVRIDEAAEGTGIGLSTCRRIIRAQGGEIGLEPREGGGTIAWFALPAAA